LEKNSITDQVSGLANRILVEKIALLEFNRVQRYFRPSSLILFKLKIQASKKYKFIAPNKSRVNKNIVKVFKKLLRDSDIAGIWKEDMFLIILPETKGNQAQEISKKLTAVLNNYQKLFDDQTVEIETKAVFHEIFPADSEAGYAKFIKKNGSQPFNSQLSLGIRANL